MIEYKKKDIIFYVILALIVVLFIAGTVSLWVVPEFFESFNQEPLEGFDPSLCGVGTIVNTIDQKCDIDDNYIINALIDNDYIIDVGHPLPIFVEGNPPNNIEPVPVWFDQWLSNGNWECADPGGDCSSEFCPVNGVCVSPYDKTGNCCPPCIMTPPSQGGCAGQFLCETSNNNPNVCEERKVTYPGKRWICDPSNYQVIDQLCPWVSAPTAAPTTAPVTSAPVVDPGLCVDPNGEDERFRSPFVYIEDPNLCMDESVSNEWRDGNEYGCAAACSGSTLECEKTCRPEGFRWLPSYSLKQGVMSYIGFYETDTRIGNAPSGEVLYYCPENVCEDGVVPPGTEATECFECLGEDCVWKYDSLLDMDILDCDRCNYCTPPYVGNEDDGKVIRCDSMKNCAGCDFNVRELGFIGLPTNSCRNCNDFEQGGGCRVYTQNPYELENTSYKLRDSAVVYNGN